MAKIKLTKTAVDAATPRDHDYELRDTTVPGFMLKVTPAGRKIFMLQYQTNSGVRRKPAIGRFGELTVEQARKIAQDWLAEVRQGNDPSAEKSAARAAPTMKQLCEKFIEEYSRLHNKPNTVEGNELNIKNHIVPRLGRMKVNEVTRADISTFMTALSDRPIIANRTLACLRKMFNLSEIWGYRPDGSNPCRHVQKYAEKGSTRFITDDEMRKLFTYLDAAERDGLEHPFLTLAIRLQFEFAARMSEVLSLEWSWIDLEQRRVTWPDSKTGDMIKPLSDEAHRLLCQAPRFEDSPFVCPSIFDPAKSMTANTYHHGWRRVLKRAGIPHVGTHGIRHRAATDIANSGVPLKVGMALTAHKTVAMFMRYIHNEDDPVRSAADVVAVRGDNQGETRLILIVALYRSPSPIDRDAKYAGNHCVRAGACRSRSEQSAGAGKGGRTVSPAHGPRRWEIPVPYQGRKLSAVPPPQGRQPHCTTWKPARASQHGGGGMKASKPVTERRIWSDAMADRAIALGSRWLRTRQAALYLNLSCRTLEKLRSSGGGPAYRKVGGTVLYRMDELDAWVDSRRFTSTSEESQADREGRNA